MPEKIKGEFLRIEERPHEKGDAICTIFFVDENKVLNSRSCHRASMNRRAGWALEEIKKHRLQSLLGGQTDQIANQIQELVFDILWPEMYIAHCKGESLSRFFDSDTKTEESKKAEPYWISKLRGQLLVTDFVPFRIFQSMAEDMGSTIAFWESWFENQEGELQKFDAEPETIDSWDILAQDEADGLDILNKYETKDYRKRVSSLSLSQLRHQKKLWKDLDAKVKLDYAPIAILAEEIQERLAEAVDGRAQLSNQRSISTNAVKEVFLEKCKEECESRSLPKGKTISREQKFDIGKAIGLNGLGEFETFRSGNSAYHRISKMLSELGYSRKTSSKYQ